MRRAGRGSAEKDIAPARSRANVSVMNVESRSAAGSHAPRAKRRRVRRWLIGSLALVALVYALSPYVSFWFFSRAIKTNDRTALVSYVDFRSVRESLKEQLRGKIPKASAPRPGKKEDAFTGLISRLAPGLIDQLVEAFVTPEGLAALITDPALAKEAKAKDPTALADLQHRRNDLNWSRVQGAHFTALRWFVVEVEGTKLRFRFSGMRWRLKTVQLPETS